MHIEPGVVNGAKLILGFATGAGAVTLSVRMALSALRATEALLLLARGLIAGALVLCFFQVLPHYSVGVSEVHFILGSTLFLLFGPSATAMGLILGLTAQGMLFAPTDLPQLGMNLTTLLVPLFALIPLARRIIPQGTRYADLSLGQALALSSAYQAGIVAWVAFWSVYGLGISETTLFSIGSFGTAYIAVILIEPIVDLAVLASAKGVVALRQTRLIDERVFRTA